MKKIVATLLVLSGCKEIAAGKYPDVTCLVDGTCAQKMSDGAPPVYIKVECPCDLDPLNNTCPAEAPAVVK